MTYVPDTEIEMEEFPEEITVQELTKGQRSPVISIYDIKETDFVRYAGASGDFNPLHYDEEYVQSRGYDNIFAMGMLNAGFLSHLITKWLGLSSVDRFVTQFEQLVFPGDDLHIFAEVADLNEEENQVKCELFIENQDEDVVVTGTVTATLSDRT
jgi:acyl dehydratase